MEFSKQIPNSEENSNSYIIKPRFDQKFRPWAVRNIISQLLKERLETEVYSPENTHEQCISLADEIKRLLRKSLSLRRYRYLVQVIIGEKKGQGVNMARRCYWDSDNDNCADASFVNDSLFCVASVFGVYTY
ncbi:unnamed protein product [Schistosoma rodhaini]|uniref:Tctex1 domain-containing protein 2 n=1 Tax=Schistosoma rodhaini TaxID=6188 RepID=A0A183QZZ8_9TREM|nr:unnamed protein product [Schistosoma rodhaini]